MTRMADLPSSVVRRNFAPDEKQAKKGMQHRDRNRAEQVLAYCSEPRTLGDVAEHFDVSPQSLYETLGRLVKDGRMTRRRADNVRGKNGARMVVYEAVR